MAMKKFPAIKEHIITKLKGIEGRSAVRIHSSGDFFQLNIYSYGGKSPIKVLIQRFGLIRDHG